MSEINNENEFYVPSRKRQPKQNNTLLILVSIMLVCCMGFSAFQTIYIFKLNTGKAGITSYETTAAEEENEEEDEDNEAKPTTVSSKAQPWFSLEEASSVSSSTKTKLSTVDIVNSVSPATVSIYIKGTVNGVEKKISSGSGFIITEDGYIVTNAHVVSSVSTNNYSAYVSVPGIDDMIPAKVIGTDSQTDIAVIKLQSDQKFPCVTLGDSDELQKGEMVVAIGNALGTLDGTVTVGVVSSLNREFNNNGYSLKVIQTDAAINEGNSGGPLINSFGEVIGVTNAKMVTTTAEGLGFAIPITSVKNVIESIINYGVVNNRPYLGISISSIEENAYFGAEAGVYIAEYVKNGPGDKAGFEIGDKILTVDGVEIKTSGDIIDVRDSHKVGDTIKFVVLRDGKEVELNLVIGDSADYENNTTTVTEETSNNKVPDQTKPSEESGETETTIPDAFDIFGGSKNKNGN